MMAGTPDSRDVSVKNRFAAEYLAEEAEEAEEAKRAEEAEAVKEVNTAQWAEEAKADNCHICKLYVGWRAPLEPKTQCRKCAVVICQNHTEHAMFNVGESMNPKSHHVTGDDHCHHICTDCNDKKKRFMCGELTAQIREMAKIAKKQEAVIAAHEVTITTLKAQALQKANIEEGTPPEHYAEVSDQHSDTNVTVFDNSHALTVTQAVQNQDSEI
jgi:hypothetical protein